MQGGTFELVSGMKYTEKSFIFTCFGVDVLHALSKLSLSANEGQRVPDTLSQIKTWIGESLHYVIQTARMKDRTFKITDISKVEGYNETEDAFLVKNVFK